MAQLLECDDCGALMTAELMVRHEAGHAEATRPAAAVLASA